jgi:hypothetical protein
MSKTSDFQVSLRVLFFLLQKGFLDWRLIMYVNINEICVQVKNKPCVECIIIMRLISWKYSRGRKTILPVSDGTADVYVCKYVT